LEKLEGRLSLIENLKRKYGGSIPEILRYMEKAKKEAQELTLSHEKLSTLDQQIDTTFQKYVSLCQTLAEKRRNCARQLEKTVEKEISNLGMKRAKFKIVLDSIPPERENVEKIKDRGTEEVEFLISPNPGEEVRPLRKIASGGELSRIMLALKSIGKETETLKTLIFDEIDSGIGGKTAEFVAQKLKDLSKQHQVVCITHLPQIASFATHHYRIEKKIEKNRTFTRVNRLSFEERVEEIARLLTGSRITETALKNAREMLVHNLHGS
jgi:DNA repair protein RecN (Recombination protein N)